MSTACSLTTTRSCSGHSSDHSGSVAIKRNVVVVAPADAGNVAFESGRQTVAPQDEEGAREADRQLRRHQARRLIRRSRVRLPAAPQLGQRKIKKSANSESFMKNRQRERKNGT